VATTAERVAALEKAVKALTARVAALESPPAPTTPAPPSVPPTVPVTPPPGTVGVPAGTVLKPVGALVVTTPGQVIDAVEVTGGIDVRARGVIIRRSRVHGSGPCAVWIRDGGSATIEDSEIVGGENGVGFGNYTLRRCWVHGQCGDGLKLGSGTLVEDCVIDGLRPAAGAHADGGQVQSGVTNLIVRRSTFDVSACDGNAALFIAPDLGPSTPGPVLVEGNTLLGGNYALYCVDGNNGQYLVGGITIRGNTLGKATYGTHNVNVPIVDWSGNRTLDGRVVTL